MHSVERSSSGSTSTPAPTNGSHSGADESLFDASEVRFLSDSLSSADTFDPFTIGAPGFKVPSLLPPLLGLDTRDNESAAAHHQQHSGVITPAAAAQLGRHASAALGLSSSANGGSPWEDAHRRPSVFDPAWLNNAAGGGANEQSSHASGSGSTAAAAASSSSNTASGPKAYGRDRAWQMAQLEALQAEREKYLAASAQQAASSQQHTSLHSSPPNLSNHASGSLHGSPTGSFGAAGPSRSGSGYGLPPLPSLLHGPAHHPGYAAQEAMPSHPPGPHGEAYAAALARYKAIAAASSSGMGSMSLYGGMLPPLAPQQQQQPQHHQMNLGTDGAAPHLGSLGLSFPSMHSFPAAPGAPGGPPLPTSNGASRARTADDQSGDVQMSDAGRATKVARTGKEKSTKAKGKAKAVASSSSAAASGSRPASAMGQALREDSTPPAPSQPAPVPPAPTIDAHRALSALPPALHSTYLAAPLDKLQPHLEAARTHRRTQRALNPELYPRAPSPGSATAAAAKKKAPHVLLTDAEKKANHIASEQKRRANIRKGYEVLCELVPSLREALNADEEEPTGGKQRKDWEVGGEKIDGRAGPRSESIVLLKTVEYLRERLEEHRELVLRRERARKLIAARYGVDISLPGASSADNMEH